MFYYQTSFAQVKITATVKDSQTGEALPFCNVSVRGTGKGTITNADGLFSITVDTTKNLMLEFSYLGYETKKFSVSYLQNNKNVFLNKSAYELQEIEIHAGNDYLYDILGFYNYMLMSLIPYNELIWDSNDVVQ